MAMYNDQKFTNAVDKVRLRGINVQEAKATAEAQANIEPWLTALSALMEAKAELDDVILAGLDMGHPVVSVTPAVETVPRDAGTNTTPSPTSAATGEGFPTDADSETV